MSTEIAAAREETPIAKISAAISTPKFRQQVAHSMAVPDDAPEVDRFTRVLIRALQEDPSLLNQDRTTLFLAANRAAQDRLLPDKRDGAMVVYGGKVQWAIMVGGVRKLAARAGYSVDAQCVYSADRFEYALGDAPTITHEPPKFGAERGDIIGAYAIYRRITTGEIVHREVMDRAAIDKVKAVSRSGDKGPWGSWYSEMARKTVLKRGFKSVPMDDSDEAERLNRAFADDNDDYDLTGAGQVPATTPAAPSGRPRVLDAVRARAQAPAADPDTGEVLDNDEPPADDQRAPDGTIF